MKQPPNLAVTLVTAVVALCAIVFVRQILTPTPTDEWWLTDERAAFASARARNKPLLVDYQATWSVPSMEMSSSLEELRPNLEGTFIPLRIDVSNAPSMQPGIAFVDPDGKVLARIRHNAGTDEIRRTAEAAIRNRRR
ncbi:MAG: thioredoxin family protein [Myxococcota bacterium]|nr:thioredoxin family protein [Myxococcota bacterium]